MKKFLLVALTLCAFSAQANIIYDKSGVDDKDFIYDEHQCTEMAQQVEKEHTSGAVGGAARGAIKGAAVGAVGTSIAGGSGSKGAQTGAGVGAALGLLGSGAEKREAQREFEAEQNLVMRNCMTNRGYTILN